MSVVRIYRSTDPSAPVVDSQPGSVIQILTACLVNGYGTFPPAGWSVSNISTNVAEYTMGPGGTNSRLWVDDSGVFYALVEGRRGSGSTLQRFSARQYFYPTTNIVRSICSRPNLRGWTLIANSRSVHLFVEDEIPGVFSYLFFGDIVSYAGSADLGRACLISTVVNYPVSAPNSGTVLDPFTRFFNEPTYTENLVGTGPVGFFSGDLDNISGPMASGFVSSRNTTTVVPNWPDFEITPLELFSRPYPAANFRVGMVRGLLPGAFRPRTNRVRFKSNKIIQNQSGDISFVAMTSFPLGSESILIQINGTWGN
jgi:hypothetical protein